MSRNSRRLGALGALVVVALVWIYGRSAATSSPLAHSEALAATAVELEQTHDKSVPTASLPDRRSLVLDANGEIESSDATGVRLLVAGQVFRRDGDLRLPLESVRIEVEARDTGAATDKGAFLRTSLRVLSDSEGRFQIPWPAEDTLLLARDITAADLGRGVELRLSARTPNHRPGSITFDAGDRVELALDAIGSLRVHIEQGEATGAGLLVCTLELAGEVHTRRTSDTTNFADLSPGIAVLTVRAVGETEPIVRLTDLVIPAGGRCVDPRLDPLDVSRAIAVFSVRVVNERGEVPLGSSFFAGTDVPLSSSTDAALLGPGWHRVRANALAPLDVVVRAYDHEDSDPLWLFDGLVVTLRSKPRFMIVRSNAPFDPAVFVELEQPPQSADAGRLRLMLDESNAARWPMASPGPARARLVRLELNKQSPSFYQEVEVGPWVEFVVQPTIEGRVALAFGL